MHEKIIVKDESNSAPLKTIILNIIVATVSFLIIVSHRISCILNPQFWAEDIHWYAGAYMIGGITPLFLLVHGYYDMFPRIVGAITQFFPLHDAPLVFNLTAIGIEMLVPLFLFSKRFAHIVPNLAVRILLGLIVIAAPHTTEIHANLTNAQWYLAILSFLIVVAAPPSNKVWKIFDVVILIVAGLSGPFSLFLFPVALIFLIVKKHRWTIVTALIVAGTAIVQSLNIFSGSRITEGGSSQYHLNEFLSIIGGQIVFSAIFGKAGYTLIYDYRLPFVIVSTIVGATIIFYTLLTARIELKLFILYAALLLTSAILLAEWAMLAYPFFGDRYCLIPITCFLFSVVYCAFGAKHLPFKI